MEYLIEFKKDLYFAGMRSRTVDIYCRHVVYALKKINKPVMEITANDIYSLLLKLYEDNASGSSIKCYFFALKYFFENTIKSNWELKRIPRLGNFNKNAPRPLTRAEVNKVISGATKEIYRIIFALMYSSGLRVSEACLLKKNDINRTDMLINVEDGKGGIYRTTVLSKKVLKMIDDYQAKHPTKKWLFIARRKIVDSYLLFPVPNYEKSINARNVQHEFKYVCQKNNISDHVSTHSLRHSFATHLIEDGLSIFSIQKLLGHKYIKTTLKYLKYAEPKPEKYFSPYDVI